MQSAVDVKTTDWVSQWGGSLVGCGLLILGSYLKVPFYPVPFTMQTCALWILAMTLKPKQAVVAVLLFLGLGTAGLPVFGGIANPLWLIGKSGGYLIGFPIAAYLVASAKGKSATIAAIAVGHCVIYLLGFLVLAPFIGAYAALMKGVVIFLPSALLKTVIAYAVVKIYKEKIHEFSR